MEEEIVQEIEIKNIGTKKDELSPTNGSNNSNDDDSTESLETIQEESFGKTRKRIETNLKKERQIEKVRQMRGRLVKEFVEIDKQNEIMKFFDVVVSHMKYLKIKPFDKGIDEGTEVDELLFTDIERFLNELFTNTENDQFNKVQRYYRKLYNKKRELQRSTEKELYSTFDQYFSTNESLKTIKTNLLKTQESLIEKSERIGKWFLGEKTVESFLEDFADYKDDKIQRVNYEGVD